MKKMKRPLSLLIALAAFAMMFSGCASSSAQSSSSSEASSAVSSESPASSETQTAEPVELSVFAAASLTEALGQIVDLYKTEAPNVTITLNLDSSGKLQTQIESGAEPDVFLSAAQKQMNALEEGGYLLTDTRKDLLVNKVVLIVPEGSDKGITSFEDCSTDKVSLLALGNSDVPVGQYSEEIFTYLGVWDELQSKISFGTNVKEVLSQVENASVDAGVVYATDAATATGIEVVADSPEGSHSPVVYPAALLKTTKNQEAAQAFLDYLSGDDAKAAFESVGFSMAE